MSWVVALALLIAPLPAASVESFYSRGVYRVIQPAIAKVAGLVPFALFDLVVIVACALTLRWFVIAILLPRSNGVRSFSRAATPRSPERAGSGSASPPRRCGNSRCGP